MVPPAEGNHRGRWAKIEHYTRGLALKHTVVYVVTGPRFTRSVRVLKGRVAVPAAVYKAIYVPALRIASVYIAPNDDSKTWMRVSPDDLEARSGVKVFPALAENISGASSKLFRWDAKTSGRLK